MVFFLIRKQLLYIFNTKKLETAYMYLKPIKLFLSQVKIKPKSDDGSTTFFTRERMWIKFLIYFIFQMFGFYLLYWI